MIAVFSKGAVFATTIAILLLGHSAGALAAAVVCGGKTKAVTSTTFMQTMSTSFVTVPETTMAFTQGHTGCVLVQFFSEYDGSTTISVRALLDTATQSLPPETAFGSTIGVFNTHAAAFVFAAVAPGQHTIKIQAKSANGSPVNLFNRTTIVSYVP